MKIVKRLKNYVAVMASVVLIAATVSVTPTQSQAGGAKHNIYNPCKHGGTIGFFSGDFGDLINEIISYYVKKKLGSFDWCTESLEEQISDMVVWVSWGACVYKHGTKAEKQRLTNYGKIKIKDARTKMYPYGDRGGSTKNKNMQAKYADAILERVSKKAGSKMKFLNKSSSPTRVMDLERVMDYLTTCLSTKEAGKHLGSGCIDFRCCAWFTSLKTER